MSARVGAAVEAGGPVTLYDYWRSSASYRVRIALNLMGIAYEGVPVNILAGEHHSPEHRARNPQGLVPVLAIDGRLLTQSLAIIEYLDETRGGGERRLLPEEPEERARVRALAYAVAMEIHPICNLVVTAEVAAVAREGEAAKVPWLQHFMRRGLSAVEELLGHPATGRFCAGERPDMADCCLVPQLYNARRWGVDTQRWPRIEAIVAACEALPAFQAAHPDRARPAA